MEHDESALRRLEAAWDVLRHPPARAGAEARIRWRTELHAWRAEARRAAGHRLAGYDDERRAWTASCFVSGMLMLFDRTIAAAPPGELRVEAYLQDAQARFGGLDAVILWHAYPRIGFDERNQLDYYRQVPGGLPGLRRLVAAMHAGGSRVLLAWYPWDVGTRREPDGEVEALARLVEDCGADGVFLDTMAESSEALQTKLEATPRASVLVPEALVPLGRVADHAMSWLQWPPEEERPYLLRNTWYEPRHMQHLIRRWHTDHRAELHLAWLNGAGVVVWENVFGSFNPWSAGDAALLRSMRPVQRHLGPLLAGASFEPFVETSQTGLYASRWDGEGWSLWALANTAGVAVQGELLPLEPGTGGRLVDLSTGAPAELEPAGGVTRPRAAGGERPWRGEVLLGRVEAGGVAAFARLEGEALAGPLGALARDRRAPAPSRSPAAAAAAAAAAAPVAGAAGPAAAAAPAAGASSGPRPDPPTVNPDAVNPDTGGVATRAAFGAVRRRMRVEYRLRECGMDAAAPLLGSVYPELHGTVVEERDVEIGAFMIDVAPVTNGEFAEFLRRSGYRPAALANFLCHWPSPAGPSPEQAGHPVVHVDLADASAYATWRGARLPTPEEWQHAVEQRVAGYGARRVSEWTASEREDARTRWCVLKGGSDYVALGSDWYADGGEQAPSWRAKFVLAWPALDRCSTVGFRCASERR